ncbi:hypothetical protein [uncultured Stenotrophomonas sp.]|uniref:hypothetical protein n=1 Tax=uncultured Stenotrophomonas sp. TaxID=165438 RepID=UPI0028E2A876|nr:hypothetical protein [uncultured Stenotrophomonas sp.]
MNNRLHQYDANAISACEPSDPNQRVSEVDEALEEHAKVLSQLSEELIRARQCFRAVLLPDAPTGCPNDASPAPIRSPLVEAIAGQTQLARSILIDLRTLNNRSTV